MIPPQDLDNPASAESAPADHSEPDGQVTDSARLMPFEDLNLAELLGQFVRAPAVTWAAFVAVAGAAPAAPAARVVRDVRVPAVPVPAAPADDWPADDAEARKREAVTLGVRLSALVIALFGSGILADNRTEASGLNVGLPVLILAFLLWLVGETYVSWPLVAAWARRRHGGAPSDDSTPDPYAPPVDDQAPARGLWLRAVLAGLALGGSLLAAEWNSNNRFTGEGVAVWWLSVTLWVFALGPGSWGLGRLRQMVSGVRFRPGPTLWILLAIVLVGGYFRLHNLAGVPPELTSDHVEKLLDAQRVLDGNPQVFFPNNGGREPLHMYLMALISLLPGLGMNFTTLKLLTALEGLLAIIVLYWMGRELIGRENARLGNLAGLGLAALVAVSFWHVALSRMGLRIGLTVIVTGLLLIFLSRALRDNRRGDFILAGLALGFGLYTYQAVRMLPIIVMLGVGLAFLFNARRPGDRGHYVGNLAALVVVAVAAFVPLLNFSIEYPQYFWMRTSGRLFGDALIQTTDEQGRLIQRTPTLQEQITAFQANLPTLLGNFRNALLMYNWKGDVLWFSNVPNQPMMDVFTGSLLVMGLAAWLARMVRRRDVVDWLLPPMLLIMLLPSALSIALPIENPSATRASGTLPVAYLFAALPLALILLSIVRLLPRRAGAVMALAVAGFLLAGAYLRNSVSYFIDYRNAYLASAPAPYSEAGALLRDFADSGGGLGNAVLLAYPYWWDHRALGMEAGVMDWPNGIPDPDGDPNPLLPVDELPRFLYDAAQRANAYRFDPTKDILIFFTPADQVTRDKLEALFPDGYLQTITPYKATFRPGDAFNVFRVPALGVESFVDFLIRNNAVN